MIPPYYPFMPFFPTPTKRWMSILRSSLRGINRLNTQPPTPLSPSNTCLSKFGIGHTRLQTTRADHQIRNPSPKVKVY